MWINHHRLFNHIKRSDNVLLVLNLALLFGVTAIPFPTAVLASHLGHGDQKTAAILFNATYVVIAVVFNVLWRYATKGGRLLHTDPAHLAEIEDITRQYAFGPVLYLVCLALVWVSVRASLILNVLLACFFVLPPNLAARRTARHSSSV